MALKKLNIAGEYGLEVNRLVGALRSQLAAGEVLDVLEVECALRTAALLDASRMLTGLLCGMAECAPICPCCGDAMHSLGTRTKRVVSLLGENTLGRGYFTCPVCHTHATPKDGLWHIENTSFTPGVRRVAAKLGSLESFDEAHKDMKLLCGVTISAKEVERIAESAGKDIADADEEKTAAVFSGTEAALLDAPAHDAIPIPRMYIEFDGSGIPMTRRELKGRQGKQPDGTSKTREAKLGCIFTQSGTDDKGNPVRDKDTTTYFGAIECAQGFGRHLYAHAVYRGLDAARELVIIADGAKWIWNLADLHFADAVQIVDVFHAKEHIWTLIKSATSDEKERKRLKKRCYALLEKGAIPKLIGTFRSFPHTEPGFAEALDREVGYFSDNAHRMQYAKFKRQGMFIGSGVIEAGCKNVIGKRLKQSGMHWSVSGANAIIALRCSIMSGTFDSDFESSLAA
jgi:hypothetical protein